MIQIINYSGNKGVFSDADIEVHALGRPKSLDEFDINIIDLRSEDIWQNKKNGEKGLQGIDCEKDFKSLNTMILNAHKTQIVIVLPTNIWFRYEKYSVMHGEYLKDAITHMRWHANKIYNVFDEEIFFEVTTTNISDYEILADFYFDYGEEILTKSVRSEKATTIRQNGIVITSLNIADADQMFAFLRFIGLVKDMQEMPAWMEGVKMFDDVRQIDIIQENQRQIQAAESRIDEAKKVIAKNNEYKSILYTNGDELVRVVFEIFEKMLGIDLSGFEDKKKEDFAFTIGERIFIGEIKGVTSNVKSENVSQLDVHYQSYLDEHEDIAKDKISALLIINHQRTKPLSERMVVHVRQIELAERNGSLIIETYMLLKMFEKYLNKELTREDCINMLSNNTGLLEIA